MLCQVFVQQSERSFHTSEVTSKNHLWELYPQKKSQSIAILKSVASLGYRFSSDTNICGLINVTYRKGIVFLFLLVIKKRGDLLLVIFSHPIKSVLFVLRHKMLAVNLMLFFHPISLTKPAQGGFP
jgi:hypothetical protein